MITTVPSDISHLLQAIPLLKGLPPHALDELIAVAQLRCYRPGDRLVAELEGSDEALIIIDGTARVTVGGLGTDLPTQVGLVHAGDCVGEMALLTGEVRSATIVAQTQVTALVVFRENFLDLMRRHPSMAAHLANVLAERLRKVETALPVILDPARSIGERHLAMATAGPRPGSRGPAKALRVALQELVVTRQREVPFLLLVAFLAALLAVRGAIELERAFWNNAIALESILRFSYVTGLLLLLVAGSVALLVFRPRIRRWLSVLFGVGMALLFNALPVLLTFDLFYVDTFTPDPNMAFSIETLHRRTEGTNVVLMILCTLAIAVSLRGFLRRLWIQLWLGHR